MYKICMQNMDLDKCTSRQTLLLDDDLTRIILYHIDKNTRSKKISSIVINIYNMKCIEYYIKVFQTGFAKELQGVMSLMKS